VGKRVTTAELFALASLALFSLADLRYRVVPGVTLFFLGAAAVAAPDDPLRVGLVVLAVAWGALRGWPAYLVLPALVHPATWAVLLTGAGVRQGVIGRADLVALGGLACLFDWFVPLAALLGVELWRQWWGRRGVSPVPALPGMLVGLGGYLFWAALLKS
jgi:hypothetical protein